jgi:hypothetical protein
VAETSAPGDKGPVIDSERAAAHDVQGNVEHKGSSLVAKLLHYGAWLPALITFVVVWLKMAGMLWTGSLLWLFFLQFKLPNFQTSADFAFSLARWPALAVSAIVLYVTLRASGQRLRSPSALLSFAVLAAAFAASWVFY